jgi:hypothetical protein
MNSRSEPTRGTTARKRGTVLIFAVAILALLAVMGTAYLLMARLERGSVRAESDSVSLDYARDAVMNIVREVMFDATTDGSGNVLHYLPLSAVSPKPRFYDYPENHTGTSLIDGTIPDESWLQWIPSNGTAAGQSQVTSGAGGAKGYDPNTGAYDIAFTTSQVAVVDPRNPTFDAPLHVLTTSTPGGVRYRYGLVIQDECSRANINVGNYDTSLTSSQDPLGSLLTTYKLFNTASSPIFSAADTAAVKYIQNPSYPAANPYTPFLVGRGGTSVTFTLSYWQNQVLTLENPVDPLVNFYDLTDELELRSNGSRGTGYIPRPASSAIWPNTLGAAQPWNSVTAYVVGQSVIQNGVSYRCIVANTNSVPPSANWALGATRDFYTTASYVRTCRGVYTNALADPAAYTLNGAAVWPAQPRRIGINRTLPNPVTAAGAQTAATIATNIASAMVASGYSVQEALAFAANYITYRYSQWTSSGGVYRLPYGPATIDTSGIVVPLGAGSVAAFAGGGDLHAGIAPDANTLYVGYAAQPFLNEVVVNVTAGTPNVVVDWAVEIANPYNFPLDVNDYRLVGDSGTIVNLTGGVGGLNASLASGVTASSTTSGAPIVVAASASGFGAAVAGAAYPAAATALVNPAGGTILLQRSYLSVNRGTGVVSTAWATVDSMTYTVTASATPGTTSTDSTARSNDNVNTTDAFQPANATVATTHTEPASGIVGTTLGAVNAPLLNTNAYTGVGVPSVRLYDRFMDFDHTPVRPQPGTLLSNFGDFCRIGRIANTNSNTVANQIMNLAGSYNASVFPQDAQVHFDCSVKPAYFTPPYTATLANDSKTVALLDFIDMTDRASDPTIDIGGGGNDINKVRLPGRINVNTAPGPVLIAIPGMTAKMVSQILAYRDRINTTTVPAPFNTGAKDFSVVATYPGKGFRTMGELLYVLQLTASNLANPPSLDGQYGPGNATAGGYFNNVMNYCTVRSDTFVVYGYIEAVQKNPGYGAFNNGTDWYETALVTDTPLSTDVTDKLFRLAKRRFVAIVDRSYANYPRSSGSFQLPRVVAIKDMPFDR